MKKLIIVLTILFFTPVWGQSIDKVILTGNTKTKESAVLRKAGIEIGKKLTEQELEMILEKIKRIYQFNIKKLEFKNNTLTLDVEEKWTLFPVPLISQSEGYNSIGIVLSENNFLGRLAMLAVGVSRTNAKWNGILYWQEDGIIAKNVGMKVLTLIRSNLREYSRGGWLVDSYESKFNMLLLTPNYRHGRHNHALGPIYIKKEIIGKKNSEGEDFAGSRWGLSYRHRYNHFKKLPILFDGFQTVYDFSIIPKGGDVDHLQSGSLRFIKPWGKHFFTARTHFSYANRTGYLTSKILGGNEGYSGYNKSSLSVQRNVGFAFQPQIYLWHRWFAAPFYEFNHLKLIKPVQNGLELNDSAVGVRISYYFKKISIPAVSMGYTRNIEDESDHFQFNVGLRL